MMNHTKKGATVLEQMYYEEYFEYIPNFLESEFSREMLKVLKEVVNWDSHVFNFNGKQVPMPRLSKWYGPLPYKYSGIFNPPLDMDDTVHSIMRVIGDIELNSCLLNLYRNGRDSIAKHKDNESQMDPHVPIYVVSLGAPRKFIIRSDDGVYHNFLTVENGSLFVMKPGFQDIFTHEIPKEPEIETDRISLTYRRVINN